ncbi:NETI motif-containing protein [Bacillaceae bacterium SIJ1]|uniref:NETI motif-containing protein n=1 Tax=Litoribacterium kuwaitense TaxID=1398745 RepID=UPI0013EAF77F|nr:NETI motif-containing protein [Litoribacterium kuwaitense]NGP46064.1 NETI motif-containing protein [Litoribacterium kuwaitense]
MTKLPKKKRFEVQEGETLDDCLDRMKVEGYQVVRRVEKPLFQEIQKDGKQTFQPIGQQVIFEGRRIDS